MYLHAHVTNSRGRAAALIALLITAALVLTACGQRHEAPSNAEVRDRAFEKLDDRLEDLDATDSQRAELESILDRALPTVYAMRDAKTTYRKSIVTELMQQKPDAKVVVDLIGAASTEATANIHTLADHAIDAHAVLDAEQRGEIAEQWDARQRDRRKPPAWMIDAIVKRGLDEIDATDAQYEYVLAKKDEFSDRTELLRAEGSEARTVIRAQVTASKVDRGAVHAEIDRMSGEMTAAFTDVGSAAATFAGTLSDEQRRTIAEQFMNR